MIKNEYEQVAEKCIFFKENKDCSLKFYNDICVVCKGQFCQRYDNRNVITLSDLSKKIKMHSSTLYNHLGNYRFDKYKIKGIKPEKYVWCQQFIDELIEFLTYKAERHYKLVDNLKILEKIKKTF